MNEDNIFLSPGPVLRTETKVEASSSSTGLPFATQAPSSSASSVVISQPHKAQSILQFDESLRPVIQNIVCTVNLGVKLDLRKIATHARNAEYNPRRFAAVIMRIRQPRTTALIFASGKIVCTGAKSEEEARMAARKFARIIQKLDYNCSFFDFKIQNMVGSVDMKFPIRLEVLYEAHSQFSSYEPEIFPGLIYKMLKPRMCLLIFVSGKIVITGAKERNHINDAFCNIYPIVRNFKK